jgi:DNA-binding beta-propeller fold protein YncE
MKTHAAIPALTVLALLAGCTQPVGPVFKEVWPPVEWPAPPDRPRIRYVGELAGEQSLGKPRPFSFRQLIAGPPPTIGFSTPMSVAVAGERVFVADGQNGAVHVLDLDSRDFRTIDRAGGAPLEWPIDLALAEGNLAVVDSKRAVVFLFTLDGGYLRTIGQGALQRPVAVAWNEPSRELWVLDAALHSLIVFDMTGSERRRLGRRGTGPGEFNFPAGLACRAPLGVAVADSMNFRVQVLDESGAPVHAFGQKGDAAGDFALPRDVAVDSEGHLYVLDNQFENVQIFDREGRLLMAWGREGRGPGEFYLPAGICVDDRDRIWIADSYNRRVQVFQYMPPPAAASE